MHEQSKSAKRRYYDGNFLSKYFVGAGLDVGCGPDSVGQYRGMFPLIKSCVPWDLENGDAQYLEGVQDEIFDFVHSSHSLEHMVDPNIALHNWIRVLKPGGHLIITVPDEDMYEHGIWPSVNNPDHKWSFTISKDVSLMTRSINVVDLVKHFSTVVKCLRISQIDDFYREGLLPSIDQTMTPNAECSIEFVCRKR
jgi:ubiquinone/menaquinone biosynthesis C-methylase UbiE